MKNLFNKVKNNVALEVAKTVGKVVYDTTKNDIGKDTRKVVETVKYVQRTAKASVQLQSEGLDIDNCTKTVEGTEVVVVHDSRVVNGTGNFVAVAMRLNGGLGDHIFVDDSFYKLSTNAQQFIAYHEEGHMVLGHLDKFANEGKSAQEIMKERKKCIKEGTVQDVELEADAYAASKVGKANALKALKELRAFAVIANEKEINNRIQAIQKGAF